MTTSNSLHTAADPAALPITSQPETLASLAPAGDILLALFKAAINYELGTAWTRAALKTSGLKDRLPVESTHPDVLTEEVMTAARLDFPVLAVFPEEREESESEYFNITLGQRAKRENWIIEYTLGQLSVDDRRAVGRMFKLVAGVIQGVVEIGGHRAYATAETVNGLLTHKRVLWEGPVTEYCNFLESTPDNDAKTEIKSSYIGPADFGKGTVYHALVMNLQTIETFGLPGLGDCWPYDGADYTTDQGAVEILGKTEQAASPIVPTFSVAKLAGLAGWFDMQDATSYTESGGILTSITNKKNDTAWNTAAITNKPTFGATLLNGHPAMGFLIAEQRGLISTDSDFRTALTGDVDFWLFIVFQAIGGAASTTTLGVANTAGSASRRFGRASTAGGKWRASVVNNDATFQINESGEVNDTLPHIILWRVEDGIITLDIDGTSLSLSNTAHSPTAQTITHGGLGCLPTATPSNFASGNLGEVIMGSGKLSQSDKTAVTSYLINRWA